VYNNAGLCGTLITADSFDHRSADRRFGDSAYTCWADGDYCDGNGGTALGTACPTLTPTLTGQTWTPTTSPTPPPPVLFAVASGACTVASTATCFRSPNYPSAYGNSQTCAITVYEAVLLSVVAFSTESGYDKLTVNGVRYSGTTGPGGVQVVGVSALR
jgi:hypothetical protein